jgi:hypothetical protein
MNNIHRDSMDTIDDDESKEFSNNSMSFLFTKFTMKIRKIGPAHVLRTVRIRELFTEFRT